MDVRELSRNQLIQLKQHYLCETSEMWGWKDLAEADSLISDAEIFRAYARTDFSPDDFSKEDPDGPAGIDPGTLHYCLSLLDTQRSYIKPGVIERDDRDDPQRAYYDGMKMMLENVISEGYTRERYVYYNTAINAHDVKYKE